MEDLVPLSRNDLDKWGISWHTSEVRLHLCKWVVFGCFLSVIPQDRNMQVIESLVQ